MALWTPADLASVTLAGWYRIRDPNGVIAQGADVYNGTDVTAWKDRSGLGNDLPRFPKNSTTDMVYQPNGFGTGLASVHTSGIYYGTGWHGPVAGVPTGKLGAFAALTPTAGQSQSGCRIISIGNVSGGEAGNQDYSSPNAIVLYVSGSDGTDLTTYFGPSATATVTPGAPLIVGTYFKGGNTQGLAVNGVEKSTLTRSYDNAPLNLGLGTNGAYKGSYWLGDHAEYVLFVGTLSLADQQKLEGYLAWNNGTQGSLPASHPYKAAAPTSDAGGGAAPAVYAVSVGFGARPASTVSALLATVSAAALTVVPGVTAVGGSLYGATVSLTALASLAGSVAGQVSTSVALAAATGLSGAGQGVVASALSVAALAAQAGAGQLSASAALSFVRAAGLTAASGITAAQVAALALAAASGASPGGASSAVTLTLGAAALTALADRGALAASASLAGRPVVSGAGVAAAIAPLALGHTVDAREGATALLGAAVALAEAAGVGASTGGGQACAAAIGLATQSLAAAAAGAVVEGSVPLPASLGLSGAAAGLYAGAVALARSAGMSGQAQAVAVAAAALAQASTVDVGPGGAQAYTAAVALAAAALQAADTRSGQAALAYLAMRPATSMSGAFDGAAAAGLAAAAGTAAAAALVVVLGTTFRSSTQALASGGLVVSGALTLPTDPAFAGRSGAVAGPVVAFTARLDPAAVATVGAGEAARFSAQAALRALLQVGDPYAGLPQLRGTRTTTLTLDGRRMGTRTLAGTVQVTLTLHGTTRH